MKINIDIVEKRATVRSAPVIVCGNTDYTLAFTFDEEWAGLDKIARLVFWREGALQYMDLALEGDALALPAMANTEELYVGAYAGDLRTTAPARIQCLKSVKCMTDEHAGDPPEDIYSQMLGLMNALEPQIEVLAQDVANLAASVEMSGEQLQNLKETTDGLEPRVEALEQGGGNGGGLTPEEIQEYIDSYLDENPPEINVNDVEAELPTGKNLLNRSTSTVGRYLAEDGVTLTSGSSYETSDYISVVGGEPYYISGDAAVIYRAISFYDLNKNLLAYKSYYKVPIIAPAGACFCRVSYNKALTQVQFEHGATATDYEVYTGEKLVDGNRVKIHTGQIVPEYTNFFTLKPAGRNLLNRAASTVGVAFSADGTDTINSPKTELSEYIPVSYGDSIVISRVATEEGTKPKMALYDVYKNLMVLYNPAAGVDMTAPFDIPAGCKYIRVEYRVADTNVQVELGTLATEYEDFIGAVALKNELMNGANPKDHMILNNPWHGKKLVVDGDSITHDQGRKEYWQFVAVRALNMVLPDSLGTNPATGQPYPGNGRTGIGGSRIANELGANDPTYSIVLRYQNYPDDAAAVFIAGGTNDWVHDNVPLGEMDSEDDTTFCGALNILCKGLKEKYPTTPVVLMTPIKRLAYGVTNKNGNTQEEFVNAMIAMGRKWNVYVLDMWATCPINPNIESMDVALFQKPDGTNDHVHPNTAGQAVMGKTVAGFLRTLS